MSDNGFTRQWAIRMPNGELYGEAEQRHNQSQAHAAYYRSMSSFMRDQLGIPEPQQNPVKPYVYDTRAEAEFVFAKLAEAMAVYGVTFWAGTIVERLCSPFTADPAPMVFADEIEAWAREQQGGVA